MVVNYAAVWGKKAWLGRCLWLSAMSLWPTSASCIYTFFFSPLKLINYFIVLCVHICVSPFDRSAFSKLSRLENQYWHTVCTRTHTHTHTFTLTVSSVSRQSLLQLHGFSFQPARWWTFRMKADPKSFWISISLPVSGTIPHTAPVSQLFNQAILVASSLTGHSLHSPPQTPCN